MKPRIILGKDGSQAEIMSTGGITSYFISGHRWVLCEGNGNGMTGGCVIRAPFFNNGQNFLENLEPLYCVTSLDPAKNALAAWLSFNSQPSAGYPWGLAYEVKEKVDENRLNISLVVERDKAGADSGLAPINPSFSLCFAGDLSRARTWLDWQKFSGTPGSYAIRHRFTAQALSEINLELKAGFGENALINFQGGAREYFLIHLFFRRDDLPFYFLAPEQKLELSVVISIE